MGRKLLYRVATLGGIASLLGCGGNVGRDSGEGCDGLLVRIQPDAPVDGDDLTAYVESYEDDTFNFYWYRDGVEHGSQTGTQSVLPASYTSPGEVWTAYAYEPATQSYDTFAVGCASTTIN